MYKRQGLDPRALRLLGKALVFTEQGGAEVVRRAAESLTDKPDAEEAAAPSPPEPADGRDGFGSEAQPPGASAPLDAATPSAGADPSVATPAPAEAVPPAR